MSTKTDTILTFPLFVIVLLYYLVQSATSVKMSNLRRSATRILSVVLTMHSHVRHIFEFGMRVAMFPFQRLVSRFLGFLIIWCEISTQMCKQPLACFNNFIQNPRDAFPYNQCQNLGTFNKDMEMKDANGTFPNWVNPNHMYLTNSVCRCCCDSPLCNHRCPFFEGSS